MSEYTPTTDEVRAVWSEWNGYGGLTYRTTPEPSRREMRQEFDAWLDQELAAARREGQAEAWADAVASAYLHETEHFISIKHDPNPYEEDK